MNLYLYFNAAAADSRKIIRVLLREGINNEGTLKDVSDVWLVLLWGGGWEGWGGVVEESGEY